MSEFDKYIKDHVGKTQFEVDPDHLHDIETRLKKRRRNPFFFWLLTGLAVISIAGVLIFFFSGDKEEIVNNDEIAINNTSSPASKEIIDGKLDNLKDIQEANKTQYAETNSVDESSLNNVKTTRYSNSGNNELHSDFEEKSSIATATLTQQSDDSKKPEEIVTGSSIESISRTPVEDSKNTEINPNIQTESEKLESEDQVDRQIPLIRTLSFVIQEMDERIVDIYDPGYFIQIDNSRKKEKSTDIDNPKIAFGPAINLEYFPAIFVDNNVEQSPIGYFGGLKVRYLLVEKLYLEASGFYGERKGGFIYEKSAENDFAGLRSRTPRNSLELKTLRYFRLDLDGIYKLRQHELIGGIGMKLLHGGKGDATYHVQGLSNEIEQILISDQWLETDGLRKFLPDLHLGYGYQFDFGLNIRLDVRAHWPKHNFPNLNADERFLFTQEFNWIYPSLTMSYLFSKK